MDSTTAQVIKIATWNVASLRARWKDNFTFYINSSKPDIICIQETKFHVDMKESLKNFKLDGYKGYFFHAKKAGYAGTCIYTKYKPVSVKRSFADPDGRCITMEFKNFYLINTYVVNAGEDLGRLDYKIKEWNPKIRNHIMELEKKKPVIWTGDLNVAHKPIDIWQAEGHEKIAGYTDEERKWFDDFLNEGHIDIYRELHPESHEFTFFNYRGQAKSKNQGWRIDYFITGKGNIEKLGISDCVIEGTIDGSDHQPVILLADKDKIMKDDEPVTSSEVEMLTAGNIKSFFG
ncbi:exodeoxyribonuclease III family protein [Trichomonas vaginalis G3]|uniref:Exodeoxyribonuclease III family protein n=1 Tax=Trichomonas vaginalis (strain ATCC PRA-98 / G3) TaxID=412133 RepID=A2E3N7_TRIV3|nr:double-stranded DNA 3'-5' exodeoxyribonuclease protein [Trichomonas vaginalis G3]EAY12675.1 exodeoxyribonuclease III family protein [Trichomonas vaginalis G3]KAI5517563.1 double-stranded DNA 3'-5' exodeoxyribonuclease protein [Trichomonas vaginalis G3]|eukprot:XP_001324898.1 exodeoxyribonuclease III family protein [Trichomonas vaginalis G3]